LGAVVEVEAAVGDVLPLGVVELLPGRVELLEVMPEIGLVTALGLLEEMEEKVLEGAVDLVELTVLEGALVVSAPVLEAGLVEVRAVEVVEVDEEEEDEEEVEEVEVEVEVEVGGTEVVVPAGAEAPSILMLSAEPLLSP
jgi:hypothetical protein